MSALGTRLVNEPDCRRSGKCARLTPTVKSTVLWFNPSLNICCGFLSTKNIIAIYKFHI